MPRNPHSYPEMTVDFDKLPKSRLEFMLAAGAEAIDCIRVLSKMGDNTVGELLSGAEGFYERDHYPEGDVYDHVTHAQFYYHAHPQELRGGEHGHFHTFMRANGMPDSVRPAALPDYGKPAGRNDDMTQLINVSVGSADLPVVNKSLGDRRDLVPGG